MSDELNPAAFPSRVDRPLRGGGGYRDDRAGMSLRDWFAGQAIASMVAKSIGQRPSAISSQQYAEAVAFGAYEFADAMLAARSTNSQKREGEGE